MGYEVTYHYHEEIAKGEYNKDEIKTKSVKIGGPYDDITLETLAGKVMAQLARRNILVVDVEIYEFTKKKISFKEASDGILIGRRKFSFDDGAVVSSIEESEEPPVVVQQTATAPTPTFNQNDLLAQLLSNPSVLAALGAAGNPAAQAIVKKQSVPTGPSPIPNKIIRYEIFNPVDKIFLEDARRRKLAFTVGKRYPILLERKASVTEVGMFYHTIDDKGQRQVMSDKFFSPDVGELERGFEAEEFKPTVAGTSAGKDVGGDGLDWSSFTDEYDMVDIRK
jgi:hypothetical protein